MDNPGPMGGLGSEVEPVGNVPLTLVMMIAFVFATASQYIIEHIPHFTKEFINCGLISKLGTKVLRYLP